MKRFLLFALCAMVSLAGCQRIEETGNTPEPEESTLKVTAVITDNSTKVTYDVVDNTVKPKWAVGDQIFGFTTDGTFTFEVTEVSTSGTATFDNGGFAPADGTTLYAVYYPGKGVGNFVDNTLAVDVTSQSGSLDGTAPAIMCATATVEDGNVLFSFENQTAIIGVKKFQTNPNELITTFKASGLVATGSIEVVGDELKLVPGTTTSDITINCEYTADTEGMYNTPVYFVAVPTEDATIDIEAAGSKDIYSTAVSVIAGDILAGNYYYMAKKLASEKAARYSNDGGTTWTYAESLAEAISGIATEESKANGKVELLKNINQNETITISLKNFSFDGNGHTITAASLSGATQTFAVDSSDISFENVKISGPGFNVKVKNKAINISKHSTLTLGKGCCITGFNSTNNGGAIHCTASTVNMTDDAKIENCQSVLAESTFTKLGGGAVFCESSSTLNMSGNASISNCKADKKGGAICLYGTNTLDISDNVLIEDCTASTSGGAIYTEGTVTIDGDAKISNCTASTSGGAIYTVGAVTIGDGVTISGCKADGMGGALAMCGSSILTMGSATVTGCESTDDAAGAMWFTATSQSTITGATFTNCKATGGNGGCVLINNNGATATMIDCTISGCSCSSSTTYGYGGAIRATAGTLTFTGGTIENCVAQYDGGGVSTSNGTVNLSGASISGCSATGNGGGVSTSGGTVNLSGVSISGCSATGNGGTFYLSGGTINVKENSAVTGGNSYVTTAGTLNITNSTYTYTGTGTSFALQVEGTGSKSTGVINVQNGSSVKATKGNGTRAMYGTINVSDSELIAAGSYCSYINSYGKGTFTNARMANTKSGGTVFYSGTSNNNSKMTVISGYFAGDKITGFYSTSYTNNRIYIAGGYFTKKAFNAKTQYSSVTVQSITAVSNAIGGVSYSFPYQAKK